VLSTGNMHDNLVPLIDRLERAVEIHDPEAVGEIVLQLNEHAWHVTPFNNPINQLSI
jgi:hypothetical protein